MSDKTPQNIPYRILKNISNKISDKIPKNISNKIPE